MSEASDRPRARRPAAAPLTRAVAEWLRGIDRPGDFCTAGTCALPAPGLVVDGVGPVALPLLAVQAEQLMRVAEPAPFGRGGETVYDPAVRRTWQIAPGRAALRGRTWPDTLQRIVRRAADGLGVAGPVTAELHKLLLYGEGGFFREHRDTEKADGMFGTLVVVLPSDFEGGALLVRHGEREETLDLRPADPAEARFAAFYADCRHEVRPVLSGFRLTLVYNLLRAGVRPQPPAHDAERDGLAAALAAWGKRDPLKLVYPLEHAYTPSALAFEALKGADAARAALLVAAAERAGCEAHLALLTIEESGSAEYTGGSGRRRWSDQDEDEDADFEVVEVCDRSEALSEWRRPDGGDPGLGPLPLDEDEVSPPGALDELEPTERSFHEATGNEGASFSRTYHVAAMVVWPRRHRLDVLAEGGLAATLPALGRLARACADDRSRPEWAQAHELAGIMIEGWPMRQWWERTETGAFLDLLAALGDAERIRAFVDRVVAPGRFERGDAAGLTAALGVLPAPEAADALARIAGGAAPLDARAAALALSAGRDISAAGARLVRSLPGPTPKSDVWGREQQVSPALVVDLVQALGRTDAGLLDAALDRLLAAPTTWDVDTVLIPAVLELGAAAPPRLREACLRHLRSRAAEPLAPPADWARDAFLRCDCRHCAELARFLADPSRETWHLAAAQAIRTHVQNTIINGNGNSGCDLETETLTRGRPHTLICRKNQASYERRAAQRRDDLDLLARL